MESLLGLLGPRPGPESEAQAAPRGLSPPPSPVLFRERSQAEGLSSNPTLLGEPGQLPHLSAPPFPRGRDLRLPLEVSAKVSLTRGLTAPRCAPSPASGALSPGPCRLPPLTLQRRLRPAGTSLPARIPALLVPGRTGRAEPWGLIPRVSQGHTPISLCSLSACSPPRPMCFCSCRASPLPSSVFPGTTSSRKASRVSRLWAVCLCWALCVTILALY